MRISDYAIKHPAVITILVFVLIVFGLLSTANLSKSMIADINIPTLMVVTSSPGVGPLDMESEVTEVLEEELGTLEGLKQMTSVSKNSISMITLELNYGESSDEKLSDVREKINNVAADLPEDLSGPPMIFQFSSSALPVMTILVSGGENETGSSLTRFCKGEVVPSLSRIEGVARVSIRGEINDVLEIKADLERLNALEISLVDIYKILEGSNISLPGGDVVYHEYSLNIRTDGKYSTTEEIGNQVIGFRENSPIYLKDVAQISITREKPENYVISGGTDALAITLDQKKGGDVISISGQVVSILEHLEAENSGRIKFDILIDDSDKINAAVGSVVNSALLGAALAVFILFVFLHNGRTTIIVAVSIPLSLLFTMVGMKLRGMTINMITLGGMTTAIGMIVDSSIVVLENIYRHLKEGMSPREAASLGTKEVGGAVIASTSTSLAVFIPILFLTGLSGLILKDVAWTIIFSLFSSMVVAIVIVPFLSALLLKSDIPVSTVGNKIDKVLEGLSNFYKKILGRILKDKIFFFLVAAALLVLSIFSFQLLGFEFLEQTDMAEIQIFLETPGGYTLEMTREKVVQVEALLQAVIPELESSVFYVGRSGSFSSGVEPNRAFGRITLTRVKDRNRHVMEIIPIIREIIGSRIPDVDADVVNGGVSALLALATGGEGFIVEVYGASLDKVVKGAEITQSYMQADPNVRDTDMNIRFNNREIVSNLLYDSMGQLGINPYEAAMTTRIIFNGVEAGSFDSEEGSIPILLNTELTSSELPPDVLYAMALPSLGGDFVSYINFTELNQGQALSSLRHKDRSRSILVSSSLMDPNVRETSRRVSESLLEKGLPPGVRWRISGSSAEIMESFRSLIVVMLIAVFLVYAVMVIQFEKFTQPLVVMSSVPFTMIGVVLSLLLFGSSLSLVSFMGIIALAGIVVNNAIVLIDYINLLRQRDGLQLEAAVLTGAQTRLKPILMTTLTTILGIIPLAVGMGEGSEIYSPLGQSIAGGLVTSTFITLFLVPAIYYVLEKHKAVQKKR
ncbi:MAG: efflux RND transporter permease subunit [Spirochaetales bacterium]|nr:efflux RND transporter permease subunit [Spirochaetales bacterium]